MKETQKLVELQNGEPTTTSLQIAKAFNKEHKNVIRDIRKRIKEYDYEITLAGSDLSAGLLKFEETTYNDVQGQKRPMFILNKDAMIFTVNKWTTKEATKIQLYYIDAFNTMNKKLEQQAQFFAPETVEQQMKREQLAIAKDNSNNAKSREVRSWLKLMKNKPEAVEMAAPKVMSILLDLPEEQLQIEPAHRYIYSAEEIGKRLGVDAYAIGIAAQNPGLKATRKEHQNRWSQNNLVGATSDDQKSRWMYTEEAFKEIKSYLEV